MFDFMSKMELRPIPTFVKENKVWIKSSKHIVFRHLYVIERLIKLVLEFVRTSQSG